MADLDWRVVFESYEERHSISLPHTEPWDFLSFLYKDIKEVKFTPNQEKECKRALGKAGWEGSAEKFFKKGNHPNLVVLLWGKGSGKGTVSTALMTYIIYLLHFLKPNPSSFFGLSPSDPLSIVVVSTNQNMSKKIFDRVKARISRSTFFGSFPIESGNKIINEDVADTRLPKIRMTTETIRFDAINLEFMSVPSRNESFEGLTLIGWVMDEASGHISASGQPNANKIFETLTSSTRELPYLGIVTSYPRLTSDVDFTYNLYKKINEGKIPNAITSHYPTWEVAPASRFESKETFKLYVREFDKEYDVPIELASSFSRDYASSVSKYIALPLSVSGAKWFDILDRTPVDLFIDSERPSLLSAEPERVRTTTGGYKYRYNPLSLKLNYPPKPVEYFMGVDAGEVDCMAALCVAHGEILNNQPTFVVDTLMVWRTDKETGTTIDVYNFFEIVVKISRMLRITKIRSDKWNTAGWKNISHEWDDKPVVLDDYYLMKNLFYTAPSSIRLPNQLESYEFLEQVRALAVPRGNSKPRVIVGYQDITDAVVSAISWFGKVFKLSKESDEHAYFSQNSPNFFVARPVYMTVSQVSPLAMLSPPQPSRSPAPVARVYNPFSGAGKGGRVRFSGRMADLEK